MASDVTNSVWHYQQMYSKLGQNGAKRHLTQDNLILSCFNFKEKLSLNFEKNGM